jgi:hypothetical protein
LAVLAVRLFRSSSLLRGDKDKDKAEEAVEKEDEKKENEKMETEKKKREKKEVEKKKAEKKEAEKKHVGNSKFAANGGANAQGVQTTATTGGSASRTQGADSGPGSANALGATNTAAQDGQSADGGGKEPSENFARPHPWRKGQALDDVERGRKAGVSIS